MKKKNRSPIYRKSKFIDGIDVKNIHCYSYEEVLEAEGKNHNPEIQFAIFKALKGNVIKGNYFEKEAKKEYLENKETHDKKIRALYENWIKDDPKEKYSHVKNWYLLYEIKCKIKRRVGEIWLKKAFEQNYPDAIFTVAEGKCQKIGEHEKINNMEEVVALFEKAFAFGSKRAAEYLIPIYLTGKFGFPQNKTRGYEILSFFENNKNYHVSWKEEKDFCLIKKVDKILENNNALCNIMVELYDKMAVIKEKIDSLIKQGKSYYKGYKLIGNIELFLDEPISIEEMESYDNAICDWQLVFEDKKPIPNKVDALDFFQNYNSNDLGYPQQYICRATKDFIYPKKKKTNRHCNFIPLEVFEKVNPDDFGSIIYLELSKYPLPKKILEDISIKEKDAFRNVHHRKSLKREYFWFEKKKILKIAKKMLEFEFSINSVGEKIKEDLKNLSENGYLFFKNYYYEQNLHYNFHHPFGIITKKDAIQAELFSFMMNVGSLSMGTKDSWDGDIYSDSWIEGFWEKPFINHHLCYLNHSLWDHCDLGEKDILKMRLKDFAPHLEIEFVNFDVDENQEDEENDDL